MNINEPQLKFGPTGDGFYDCLIEAAPLVGNESVAEHFDIMLTLTTVDRPRDTPILVMPRNHAIRLIKELASSVLAGMD